MVTTTTTFTKLRQNAKSYFDAVEKKGAVVRVVRHGKVIAEIVPPRTQANAWKKQDPSVIVPGVSLSRAILQEREQKRL